MRSSGVPLLWDTPWAAVVAAIPFCWIMAIELGTSRRVDSVERSHDHEVDEATGRFFDLAAAVVFVAGFAFSLFVGEWTIRPRWLPFVSGVLAMVAALMLSAAARRHLGRFHRNILTSHHDHELVSTGPYGVIRHPLYTATLLAFVGIGLVLGNWASLAVACLLPLVALVRRVRVEEQILHRRLGEPYAQFCADRSRLVPFIW